jgi:Acetokinase family
MRSLAPAVRLALVGSLAVFGLALASASSAPSAGQSAPAPAQSSAFVNLGVTSSGKTPWGASIAFNNANQGSRRGDGSIEPHLDYEGPGGTQPGLRSYDEADRNRRRGPLTLNVIPNEFIDVTGGIGENAASIRARVSADAAWLGVELDAAANVAGAPCISNNGSGVSVWVIPTNEEALVAHHTRRVAFAV